MSIWLTRALELIEAERSSGELEGCAVSANSANSPPNGTIGTIGRRLDPAELAERTSILQFEGAVPEIYAGPFAAIQQRCPPGIPKARWWTFIRDGGVFLDWWGTRAAALGWLADDLFQHDAAAPLARYDRLGLVWMLNGRKVVALTDRAARLADGLSYRRQI